jgi:DNA-directed RNA polymerase subunit F
MIQKLAAGMSVGSEDTSPLAQAVEKEDYLVNVIKALQGQTKAQEEYGSISKEVMAEQQRAAKERQEQLQKASSPINYISDLLIGYAAADPEAGLGAQLGGAATYAEEQKKTVQDEITKIQTELLEGQISQAEADVKLAQLGVESASDLYTLYGSAKNYLPDRSNLSTFGKDIMGIAADSDAGGRQLAKAVEETMTEAQSIIDDDPSAYRNKADQQALAYKILRKKLMPESEGDVNVETPNAAGNRSVDGKTSIPSPTAKADELLKM